MRDQLQNQWAAKFISSNRRNLMHIAPRSGKIKLSINILNLLPEEHPKVLISYPDNKIKESWIKDFIKFGYENPNVIFVNNSSLDKYVDEKDIYLWIPDEIHSLSEHQIECGKSIARNSKFILGLSGSISKDTKFSLKANLGLDILVNYSIEEAIRDGLISNYNITIHSVALDNSKKELNKKGKYVSEKEKYDNYTYVIEGLRRQNKDTMYLAIHRNNILKSCYSKQIEIKNLLKKMKDKRVLIFTGLQKVSDNLDIPSYHSKSKSDKNYQDFMDKKINHLALVNMGGIGTTYGDLDSIIMSNFTYNSENTLQQLCRALVLDYNDKVADLHIITTSEPAEIKKLKESLKIFDNNKINWF